MIITPSRAWTGVVLAVVSSWCFALNMTLGRLSYESGADAFTLNLVRMSAFALLLLALLKAQGRPIALPRHQAASRILIGILLSLQILAALAAIAYLPIGLAILVSDTYPFAIAAVAAVLDRHRLPCHGLAAMALAFAGLALALGARADILHPIGLALAAFAAASFAVVLLWTGRSMAGTDSKTLTFHIMASGAVFLGAVALIKGGLAWPQDDAGWAAFAASSALFGLATLTLFLAIERIGALKTSFIDFGSPVWTILFGILLLGEEMTPMQWLGAALVVVAIIGHQAFEVRRR